MIILKYCSIQNKLLFNSKYIFPILEILGMEKKKKEKRKKLVLEIEKLIIAFFYFICRTKIYIVVSVY